MTTSSAGKSIERLVVLLMGAATVGVLLFIVLRNRQIDPSLAPILRFLIATGAGVVGAFLPGATTTLSYKVSGLAIRAAGGAALFVMTWFGTPSVVPQLQRVELLPITTPDLRASQPAAPDLAYLKSTPVLVLPVGFQRNGKRAATTVNALTATVRFGNQTSEFSALHLTALLAGVRNDGWVPNYGALTPPITFPADSGVEVAFYPAGGHLTWEALLAGFQASGASNPQIRLTATIGDQVVKASCNLDAGSWIRQMDEVAKANGKPPARLSLRCLET